MIIISHNGLIDSDIADIFSCVKYGISLELGVRWRRGKVVEPFSKNYRHRPLYFIYERIKSQCQLIVLNIKEEGLIDKIIGYGDNDTGYGLRREFYPFINWSNTFIVTTNYIEIMKFIGQVPMAQRISPFEFENPALPNYFKYYWIDPFICINIYKRDIWDVCKDILQESIYYNAELCFVSPDVHGLNEEYRVRFWELLKDHRKHKEPFALCTSFPFQARMFFD